VGIISFLAFWEPTRWIFSLLLLGSLSLSSTAAWSAPAVVEPVKPTTVSPPVGQANLDKRFAAYTLQKGTAMQVVLQTPVSTAINQLGDPVEGVVNQNIYLKTLLLVPQGTRVFGEVTRLEPAIQGRDAILAVRFNGILLQDNQENLPISAHVRTGQDDQSWGGGATDGSIPYSSTQRVWYNGEYNRTVYGGPWKMGSPIKQSPGEFWTLVLDTPLTIVKSRLKPTDEEEEDSSEHKIPVF
jgi:hypothetical protein